MFRTEPDGNRPVLSVTALAVLLLLAAVLLNSGACYLIVRDDLLLGKLLEHPDRGSVSELRALRQRVDFRILTRLLTSAVLMLAVVVILWLRRHQGRTQRTLDRVRLTAYEILSSIATGVVSVDLRGTITSINSAALRILGVDSRCIGRPLARISTPDIPLADLIERVDADRAGGRDHDLTASRDGRISRLRVDLHDLKDASGRLVGHAILLRDRTEQILMEERVRRMERFIHLGSLAAGLQHEIKNPLTALSIHVQLLEEQLAGTGAIGPSRELIDVLKAEIERLNAVLNSFQDFAHWQALDPRPTDPFAALQDILRLVRPQAARQGVRIALEGGPPTARVEVPLDVKKFEQAVLNLILNALEAMPAGGSLIVAARVEEGAFRVEVRDNGPGIPPEVQRHLFKPYVSTKPRGSGLGLALTEKLVGQHGGRIDYTTNPAGTAFRLTFPMSRGEGDEDGCGRVPDPDRG